MKKNVNKDIVENKENKASERPNEAENLKQITYCNDGKYRWVYEFNMWRNPSILLTVLKIFAYIILGFGVIDICFGLYQGNGLNSFIYTLQTLLIMAAIFFVLTLMGYAVVAARYKGKYVVLFEMDENGILHRQMKDQVKKASALGFITSLAGIAAGNPTTIGAGLLAATKTSSYSTFSSVRSVKAYRCFHLIKVNEPFCKNQIYVDEDFDFVCNYIRSRCPKAKK